MSRRTIKKKSKGQRWLRWGVPNWDWPAQSDENETSNYTKPTLNNSPPHPTPPPSRKPIARLVGIFLASLIAFLQVVQLYGGPAPALICKMPGRNRPNEAENQEICQATRQQKQEEP